MHWIADFMLLNFEARAYEAGIWLFAKLIIASVLQIE